MQHTSLVQTLSSNTPIRSYLSPRKPSHFACQHHQRTENGIHPLQSGDWLTTSSLLNHLAHARPPRACGAAILRHRRIGFKHA
eukprot:3139041-Pleurochrysis_carterae.AAC.1